KFTQALSSTAEDPFQLAPALLAMKAGLERPTGKFVPGEQAGSFVPETYGDTAAGKVIDNTVSKTASVITKPVSKVASGTSYVAQKLAQFGTSQATGMSPDTIKNIINNPDEFSPSKMATNTRENLASEVFGKLNERINDLSETGKEYQSV